MQRLLLLIGFMLTFVPNAFANWEFSQSRQSIYTIHEASDYYGDPIYFALEVLKKDVTVHALYSLSEYRKYYNGNPAPLFSVGSTGLVRNADFYWGRNGQQVSVNIDSNSYNDFTRTNGYQITATSNGVDSLIDTMKVGNSFTLNHHYWVNDEKVFPTFSLAGFTAAYNEHLGSTDQIPAQQTFPVSGLRCFTSGERKLVWLKTNHGVYALNGQAIEFFNLLDEQEVEGLERKLGRDHIDQATLRKLIGMGLQRCN